MKGAKVGVGRGSKAGRTPHQAQGRPGRAASPRAARPARLAPLRAAPATVRPTEASGPSEPSGPAGTGDWRSTIDGTVDGLGYEVVDVERIGRGLLRVTIDRVPGRAYAQPGEAVIVQDCEAVTRQLRYALEVDGLDYSRLEVSSPGLDRPLKREADFERFSGHDVSLTLKLPFQGRKHFQGRLERGEAGWQLVFEGGKVEQVLSFSLDELREARLVPQLNFKGRQGLGPGPTTPEADSQAGDGKR